MQPTAPDERPAPAPFTTPAPSPLGRHAALAVAFVAFCALAIVFTLYRSQLAEWNEPGQPPSTTVTATPPAASTSAPAAAASQPSLASMSDVQPASATASAPVTTAAPLEGAATAASAADAQAPLVQATDPLAAPGSTPVSRCERDGRITYSDSGCAPGATGRPVEVGPDKNTVVRMKPPAPASAPLVIEMPSAAIPTPATDTAGINATRLRACAALDQQLQQIEADVRLPNPPRSADQLTADRKRVSEEYARLRC